MTDGFNMPDLRQAAGRANLASRRSHHLPRLAVRVKDEALPDFGAAPAPQIEAPSHAGAKPKIKRGRR